MHEHKVQHRSHALEPAAAIEQALLLDVQPTMLSLVLQLVWKVVLGAIHNCISVMPCPTFCVLRLTNIQRSIGSITPDAPWQLQGLSAGVQEHGNTTTQVLLAA